METDGTNLAAVESVKAELGSAMAATKCHRCGCFQDAVLGFSRSPNLKAYLGDLIIEAQALFEAKRYDCLGCEICWPAVASNAAAELDPVLADASCCSTAEPAVRDGWPPLPGDYRVLRFHASVAVCTLNSDELVGQLASMHPPELAIVGTLHTENLGIEHLIRNLLPNPNVRFLVVCGEDTRKAVGHLPGQSLLSLMSHGIDDQGRILQANGKRPVLKNISREHIEAFRRRIEVINLLGVTNLEQIGECIAELASRNPGPSDEVLQDTSSIPVEDAIEPTRLIPDPAGYFVLYPEPRNMRLVLEHYTNAGVLTHVFEGASPAALYSTVIEAGLISRLDHAAYLGRELGRAEAALRDQSEYVQDKAAGVSEDENPLATAPSCGCSKACH